MHSLPWLVLMNAARRTARNRRERVRVTAVRNQRGRWQYVIDCPSWCLVCEESKR